MHDLFISYSSKDRPWAEKLFLDLKRKYPTIKTFWDRESIPPGAGWRKVLDDALKASRFLALFWSQAAEGSKEVGPEVERFEANVGGRVFYIPLEGSRGGGMEDLQGFPDLRTPHQVYDATAADRGLSKFDSSTALQGEWARIVRLIGDAILAAVPHQIKLALVTMHQAHLPEMEPWLNRPVPRGPTLAQFLADIGLSWSDVKPRYGANAYEWKPFGGGDTIIDLVEEVRVEANSKLGEKHRFGWYPIDLVATVTEAADGAPFLSALDELIKLPSVVIVDPISLYHLFVNRVFMQLQEYVSCPQSTIVSLSPLGKPGRDALWEAVRSGSSPVLNNYFDPKIPPLSALARCAVNLHHLHELQRLVRCRLGLLELERLKADSETLRSMGGTT